MSNQGRVLIIEDNSLMREEFQEILTAAGYEVDLAGTKAEALEKIRCRTYHVALVDIMLTNDPSDRGGLDCLEYISRLKEGTRAVVLSATDDIRVSVDALQEKGAAGYLIKGDIRSSDDIARAVATALQKCELNHLGKSGTLTAFLSAPDLAWDLEHKLQQAVGGDMKRVYSTLDALFAPIIPVVKPKRWYPLSVDTQRCTITGLLWSKAIGAAVWLSASLTQGDSPLPPEDAGPSQLLADLTERAKLKGQARIWRVTKPRDDFRDSLFD